MLVELSEAERQTAVLAAATMGLNVAGVDMVRGAAGPLVLEVNSSPGLSGIEQVTGEDLAGLLVDFIETHAEPQGKGGKALA